MNYCEPSRIADDRKIKVVFFKENLSTGWDCPRAETMMSFRHANDATYSILDSRIFSGDTRKKSRSYGLEELDPAPHFDLVIIDEAHHIRNGSMDKEKAFAYKCTKYFCDHADAVVMLDTVITPTDKAIAGFKEKTGAMLRDYSYKENLPSDIFPSQSNLLIHNYLERGLWKAMIGNSTFAASFLSSEWNYTIYKLSDNLDLTGIITGYLKSVEQLLYAILSLSSDTGATAKTRDGRIVSFSTENEDIDTTLKSLEMTMQHNNALWDTTSYVKRYVIEAIDEWRRTQRNGYFHKHNLYSVEAVKEIREKVIFLYFLILGACSIKDDQFDAIGIIPQNQQELDFSYNSFVQWVEPILKYGFPKTTVAISFNLYASKTLGWEIQLTTTSLFDVNNERWNWNPVYSSGHNIYSWGTPITELPTKDEEAAAIKIVYQALQQYIESGTYAEKLSCYKAVSISGARSTEFVYMSSSC